MALLALLDHRPAHGFALKRDYDRVLGHDRELRTGQVYATLGRLERDGLAGEVGLERGQGPDRKVYAITPAGVSELDRWLSTASSTSDRPSALFTRVVLALVSGRSVDEVLDAQREVHLARMRELTRARHDGDAVDRMAADFEIAHLQADLTWIEGTAARLPALRASVAEALR